LGTLILFYPIEKMGRKNKSYHFSHQHLYPYLHMGISLIPRYHSNLGSLDTNYIVFINDEFFKNKLKSLQREKKIGWRKFIASSRIFYFFKFFFFKILMNYWTDRCQNLPGIYIYMYVQELVGSGFWSCSPELTTVKTVPHGFFFFVFPT